MKLPYPLLGILALTALLGLRQVSLSTDAPRTTDAPAKAEVAGSFQKDVLPFLTKHCYHCHGNGKEKGGVSLDKYKDDDAVQKDRKTWDSITAMIRTGEMPPKERPRPTNAEVEHALKGIGDTLARFDCTGPRNPGRVTLRRLNKAEYNNTIRDLVGIDFQPANDFPNDDAGYGFDNIGDVLSLSPLLLEKYLAAAEAIVEQAVVIADPPKPAKRKITGSLRPSPRSAGPFPGAMPRMLHSKGELAIDNYLEAGEYVIRVEAFGRQAGDEAVRMSVRVNGTDVKEFDVKNDKSAPKVFEAKTTITKSATARVSAAFLNPYSDPKADDPQKDGRQLLVNYVEIDGPHNAPPPPVPDSHKKIMAHKEGLSRREAAREIVTRFASGAFRRPAKPEEVERFLKLYDLAEKEGERWEKAVRLALQGVLVSPHFLFKVELDPEGAKPQTAYPVGEYELATRLSYFLWSSMPDDELFGLAAKGKLRQELEAQVRRMIKDPKSSAFVQNFAGQWLTLRNLQNVTPDPKTFPNFDEPLRAAMVRETELFFEAILREDRSILDLLDADFTFVNERLARHYGIQGVRGKEFQRVKAPPERGGVLTHASILTLTSNPTRTSPVKRGKWVLEQVFNTPPPPPPPDAGELQEDDKAQLTGSLRRRMEQHRAKASCAVCHNRLDPLGFAFENFDAVGAFRTKDGKFDIDPAGALPDGQAFKGPAELKTILKGKKELFARCLTEKMLTYALGRGVEHYDKCAIDQAVAALAKDDYRFVALLLGVVRSEPFQMRTAGGNPKSP